MNASVWDQQIMKTKILTGLITLILLSVVSVFPRDDKCSGLQKLIDETYDFKPSELSEEEKNKKSAEMDVIWEKVDVDKETLVLCIKRALGKKDANNFFIFDAANLLMSINPSEESKKILINSYAKVDLEDVDLAYWMPRIAFLGYEGFDTSAAGQNWMKTPNPAYYMNRIHRPGTIDKATGALIIYGSMDEKFATPALSKIASQKDHIAREMAIELLTVQATPEAYLTVKNIDQKGLSEKTKQLVKAFLARPLPLTPREPQTTRQQWLEVFQQLVDGDSSNFMIMAYADPNGDRDVIVVMKKEDIPLIRKVRRYFASRANPDSPAWYKSFTDILLTMINKEESNKNYVRNCWICWR